MNNCVSDLYLYGHDYLYYIITKINNHKKLCHKIIPTLRAQGILATLTAASAHNDRVLLSLNKSDLQIKNILN
jgi:hypothetical protein